jgi:DNA-binding NtrC family response regulator
MAAFLIVDEDRNFRDALAIGLRLDGHHAVALADADEARTWITTLAFDCCLVDAHLPGADALLENAAASGLRAIATGPYADLLAAAAARHPRADALAKPFRAADLVARAACPPNGAAARPPPRSARLGEPPAAT